MGWNRFHLILAVSYLVGLLLVGILAGRKQQNSNQFLNATASLPLWICIIACIAANCGSLDVIAMMALGAQYGILAAHFYWIGAIPALIVMIFWLLPAYARGRYPTILDFIARYYGGNTRALVALCMAVMMLLLSGVCLCAAAQALVTFLGWSFLRGVLLTAPIVLFYTWSGGFRATIYNELLHFAVVLAAIVPLSFFVIRDYGGIGNLLRSIPPDRLHAWKTLPVFAPQATMDRFGLILGLGLVLSFGYWSTDLVLMQRALAVRRESDVRFVPLALAAAKLVFAVLIVLPGIVAPLVLRSQAAGSWNTTLPAMLLHYYSPSWVLIGIMGLVASLVATFANNISGFTAAWVQGVYRPKIHLNGSEAHYVWIGRMTSAAAVLLSIAAAYAALKNSSMMDYMQMIFSTFNAPLFALVLLAALVPRRVAYGGLGGFIAGLVCTVLHQVLAHAHILTYGSRMSTNFYGAILGFSVALIATLAISHTREASVSQPPSPERPRPLPMQFSWSLALLATVIVCVCIALNLFFW